MTTSSTNDLLAEVWAIKDSLSAHHGHSLKATCRAMYAEQQKHPGDFVNLGASPRQNEHALQRTAPCVTAPASAAAFPPAVQVPRRTLRSLSLGSLGD